MKMGICDKNYLDQEHLNGFDNYKVSLNFVTTYIYTTYL